jgi:putative acetyltransferase
VSDLDVRRALPADAEAVTGVIERSIRVSAAGFYPADAVEAWATGRTVEAVRAMIEATDGFVATVGDAVVGWANLHGDEIDQLYVDPDAGGQGVARRLYETVEALARDNGLIQLRAVASLPAEPAFRRFGFRELARHDRAFGGQTFTVVRTTKNLDETGNP